MSAADVPIYDSETEALQAELNGAAGAGANGGRPDAARVIVLMCHEDRDGVFDLLERARGAAGRRRLGADRAGAAAPGAAASGLAAASARPSARPARRPAEIGRDRVTRGDPARRRRRVVGPGVDAGSTPMLRISSWRTGHRARHDRGSRPDAASRPAGVAAASASDRPARRVARPRGSDVEAHRRSRSSVDAPIAASRPARRRTSDDRGRASRPATSRRRCWHAPIATRRRRTLRPTRMARDATPHRPARSRCRRGATSGAMRRATMPRTRLDSGLARADVHRPDAGSRSATRSQRRMSRRSQPSLGRSGTIRLTSRVSQARRRCTKPGGTPMSATILRRRLSRPSSPPTRPDVVPGVRVAGHPRPTSGSAHASTRGAAGTPGERRRSRRSRPRPCDAVVDRHRAGSDSRSARHRPRTSASSGSSPTGSTCRVDRP